MKARNVIGFHSQIDTLILSLTKVGISDCIRVVRRGRVSDAACDPESLLMLRLGL